MPLGISAVSLFVSGTLFVVAVGAPHAATLGISAVSPFMSGTLAVAVVAVGAQNAVEYAFAFCFWQKDAVPYGISCRYRGQDAVFFASIFLFFFLLPYEH